MQEDLHVSGNVKHASFIGTRTNAVEFDSVREPGSDPAQSQVSVNNQRRTIGIVGGRAAVILFAAIIMFVVARPRRFSNEEPEGEGASCIKVRVCHN